MWRYGVGERERERERNVYHEKFVCLCCGAKNP